MDQLYSSHTHMTIYLSVTSSCSLICLLISAIKPSICENSGTHKTPLMTSWIQNSHFFGLSIHHLLDDRIINNNWSNRYAAPSFGTRLLATRPFTPITESIFIASHLLCERVINNGYLWEKFRFIKVAGKLNFPQTHSELVRWHGRVENIALASTK